MMDRKVTKRLTKMNQRYGMKPVLLLEEHLAVVPSKSGKKQENEIISKELQREMETTEFLRGHNVPKGTVLESS